MSTSYKNTSNMNGKVSTGMTKTLFNKQIVKIYMKHRKIETKIKLMHT